MRVIKGALIYSFFLLLLLTGTSAVAQQSANHVPNLRPSEFTEKGISQGWQEGQQVPDLKIRDVFSKEFQLHDLTDKPLIIEFWSVNSEQGKKNKKYLKTFYNQYNINVLGICPDDYVLKIQSVNRSNDLPWSNVQDNSKGFSGKTFAQINGIEDAKFLMVLPGGIVHKIFYSESDIGKVAVELQKFFKS